MSDAEWASWLRDWLRALATAEHATVPNAPPATAEAAATATPATAPTAAPAAAAAAVAARLRGVNPKYIAREWMLAEAYAAAAIGDYAPVYRCVYSIQQSRIPFKASSALV